MSLIFLVGYMGCGKTTVGKLLSERLGLPLVDLDTFIENRFHKSISQLFAEKGEPEFRRIEHAALEEVSLFENTIVATGGGAACFHDNMALMNSRGMTVYLRTPVGILDERLKHGKSHRPLVNEKSDEELKSFITEMLLIRTPYYMQAQLIVDSKGLLDFSFVEEIVEKVTKRK